MIVISRKSIYLSLIMMFWWIFYSANYVTAAEMADTYYSAQGFDYDGDGQVDYIDTGQEKLLAVELPGQLGTYLQSDIGGIAAPMAYYPNAARILTEEGLDILVGDGTFKTPQLDSALEFRTKLYSTSGANALKAFYTTAIQAFTPKLLELTAAEEKFREALRVNPFYQDALNGLLEVYYARAEGFMLIGNDYIAKAYRHKYVRAPNEDRPIVDLEVESIDSALISYEVGFREFMKLFNPEFVGLSKVRKPHLDIDPEWLFFNRRMKNPSNPYGDLVAFEALRGQKNAVGISSSVFDDTGVEIGPVQGSPSLDLEIANSTLAMKGSNNSAAISANQSVIKASSNNQDDQWNTVDAPVKFQLPIITGSPDFTAGTTFTLHFRIDSQVPVKVVEVLIEFDYEKLEVPNDLGDIDFTNSDFPENTEYYGPGTVYKGIQIFANQILIRAEATSSVSGNDLSVVRIPFLIKSGQLGSFNVYAAGSGGSLLSGYKDIAILYRLAAAHANATGEKVRRLYNNKNEASIQDCIAYIQEEVDRIGSWFEHLQALLVKSSTPVEIANIDQLQSAINQVAAELSSLSALREFARSGANVFGFPDDYVPFYDAGDGETFNAVRNLVLGQGAFTPQSASGFFGTARETETYAVLNKNKFEDTKDRIRNELFTINEQAENRLVQICGRVNNNGEPSLSVNDPIDYDMLASPRNLACEIGQNVLLLEQALTRLKRADADINQFLEDIEIEKRSLQEEVKLKEQVPGIIAEFSNLQQNLDKEISKVNVEQIRLNAVTQATATILSASNAKDIFSGGIFSAGAIAALQLANGMKQAELEQKKNELQIEKSILATEERIKLTEIDTELYKLQRTKDIEKMVNDVVLYTIAAQIAEIDVQLALGQLNKLILERDELLARRGRAIANLGEMSFADPSFRLVQFKAMKDAEIHIEFLKRWIYVLTRSLYYTWGLQDDYVIQVAGLPDIGINDIRRIQVVGALNEGISETPLDDELTAMDYVEALLTFNDTAPLLMLLSDVQINRVNSNNSARYSLREDFLRIVRTESTPAETKRVRDAFKAWITSPDRLDQDGNLVLDFDTMGHMENYNLPVNETHGTWTNFALRSYSNKPLWNHKVTKLGVALKAIGLAFKPGVMNVTGSIEYGGTGYIKGNSYDLDDFRAYRMKQWRNLGNGRLEPVEVRTVGVTVPTSNDLESNEDGYMVAGLKERPVTASLWRLVIPKSQVANIELGNIEDIYIYIYSEAYLRQ